MTVHQSGASSGYFDLEQPRLRVIWLTNNSSLNSYQQRLGMDKFEDLRQQMIYYQLVARGLHDQSALNALNDVPREKFVPSDLVEFAYNDSPLPIAARQTISQPYNVSKNGIWSCYLLF